jgi:hypothetical protein
VCFVGLEMVCQLQLDVMCESKREVGRELRNGCGMRIGKGFVMRWLLKKPRTFLVRRAEYLRSLVVAQLVKTFPALNGTQRFVTVFTRTRY